MPQAPIQNENAPRLRAGACQLADDFLESLDLLAFLSRI
jgi:hypothetical protein